MGSSRVNPDQVSTGDAIQYTLSKIEQTLWYGKGGKLKRNFEVSNAQDTEN